MGAVRSSPQPRALERPRAVRIHRRQALTGEVRTMSNDPIHQVYALCALVRDGELSPE